jgi:hypothetical protein
VHDRPDTVERLREAVISLERGRQRERELRALEASMVDVVRVLALADHRGETFDSLLEALRGVLPFEEAAILVVGGGAGTFRAVARTCDWLAALRLRPGRMLARVVAGEIVAAFDVALIPEWLEQPPEIRARARSVIHVPLRAGPDAVLLVCTHAAPARFEQRHIDMVRRLVPLVGQVLQKLDLRETLAARDHERRARLAMFDAIVSHIPAGVLIEDDERRVFAANELLRTIFAGEPPLAELVGTDAGALHARFARTAANPEAFAARTQQIVRERAVVSGEAVRLGNGRVVERDYVPVLTADAGLIAHFWQYRDLTAAAVTAATPRPLIASAIAALQR